MFLYLWLKAPFKAINTHTYIEFTLLAPFPTNSKYLILHLLAFFVYHVQDYINIAVLKS